MYVIDNHLFEMSNHKWLRSSTKFNSFKKHLIICLIDSFTVRHDKRLIRKKRFIKTIDNSSKKSFPRYHLIVNV